MSSRIDRTGEGPNIAGVSLALYLLVSILSMMAAYEVGKASDDVRNSVVLTLQSTHNAPNKSGDDGRDDPFVVPAVEPIFTVSLARVVRWRDAQSRHVLSARVFNARAPPVHSGRIG